MTARDLGAAALAAGILIQLVTSSGCESRKVGAITAGTLEIEVLLKDGGKPCRGIALELEARGRTLGRGTTDEEGRTSFPRVSPGKSTVRAKDPGGTLMAASLEVEVPGKYRLELEAGVEALLDVLDASASPLEDVAVTVWSLGHSAQRFSFEGGGRLRFGPLRSGHAKILVAARGHRAAILDAELKPGSKRREQDLGEVRLARGGSSLRGEVRLKGRKRALEAVLRYEGIGQIVGVREDGSFEFHGLPVAGGGEDPGSDLDGRRGAGSDLDGRRGAGSDLDGRRGAGSVMLVLLDRSREVYAREFRLSGGDLDVGVVRLD